jgi:hypothetical protein
MTDLVYIMGHGYSGSTLLTFLLGSHPRVATIGELGIAPRGKTPTPEEYFCSCQAPILECDFWQRVTRRMAERGHPFDIWESDLDFRHNGGGLSDVVLRAVQRGPVLETVRNTALRVLPGARREMSRVLARIEALVETVLAIQERGVFLDSSKRPERAVFMSRVPSFKMKVIHLVRDGRAVSWSSMKNLGIGPEEAARSWVADNQGSEHARHYFSPDRWLTLRYEDLCTGPEETLTRIYDFIGVPAKNGIHDFRSFEHHIIGNRMRLDSTSEIRLDERWKQALTREQMATVERHVGPLNQKYGYGAL